MQRTSFLSGMIYYQATALGVIFVPLPGLLMVWFCPKDVFWYNMIFSLPSLLFGTLHMSLWNRQPYGMAAVRTRQISYYAHLLALWDRAFGSVMEWIPTGTVPSKVTRFWVVFYAWSLLVPALGYLGAWMNWSADSWYDFTPFLAVTTFYLLVNLSCGLTPLRRP